ncbi:MAG: small conductance mechanosensitive channel [Pseudohongiellaceae bacterium]|jgi:small conductance mechanosensitive channel
MSSPCRFGLTALVLAASLVCPLPGSSVWAKTAVPVAAPQSLTQLEAQAATQEAKVKSLQDAVAAVSAELSAADDSTRDELRGRLAEADAALDSAAEELLTVVNSLDDKGGDVSDLRILLLGIQGVRADNLDAGALGGMVAGWVQQGKDWLLDNGPGMAVKAVVFLLILLVFKFLSALVGSMVDKATKRSKLDMSELLRGFFVGSCRKVVFLAGLMFAFSSVGVDLTPILTGLGVLGFVVGFALQDTLGNFAAGIMILLYRPFDLGDVVEAGGTVGKVTALSLVSATMTTPDNQVVIVPNGSIWGGTIRNVTANATRRVDLALGVGYDDDLDKARAMIERVVTAHPLVLKDPGVQIEVSNLGESSVDFVIRPWSKTGDYWAVYFDLTKQLKQACDAEGFSIPYPQRDIHLHGSAAEANA